MQADDPIVAFTDLNMLLRKYHAHLAVFLHYLHVSQSNPSALLFYLITNIFKVTVQTTIPLNAHRWALEIYTTFIAPDAVSSNCSHLIDHLNSDAARQCFLLAVADRED